MTIRLPAAAGRFYPSDPTELAEMVDGLLAEASPPAIEAEPVGLIVPHAGYAYSGPIAASGYAVIGSNVPRSALLLGPSHFVPLVGCAVPSADGWMTPLSEMPIDRGLRAAAEVCGSRVDDRPHEVEHSLEVQLPYLQRLGVQSVLPVAVGSTEPGQVADLIGAVRAWSPDALIVTSTDLSHYHESETARSLDRRTADAVVARDVDAIGPQDACGVFALRGAIDWCRREDLGVQILDLRNSADTAGDTARVVGYGAFRVFSSSPQDWT